MDSITTQAVALRQTLKRTLGYTSRDVSVRADGSALRVVIKRVTIAREKVEALARPYEAIHRCDITGEILSGGNRYVTVDYSQAAQDVLTATWRDAVDQAVRALDREDALGNLMPVAGTPFMVGYGWNSRLLQVWRDRMEAQPGSIDGAALYIGEQMAGTAGRD